MWGLRALHRPDAGQRHMFPTHVGIARTVRYGKNAHAHVPYACGDCAELGGLQPSNLTCSLRMWGLREKERAMARRVKMFPTHVGIARQPFRRGRRRQNVPYACGDCADAWLRRCAQYRCSLRMWGLRVFMDDHPYGGPMFPTHVGIARRWSGRSPCTRHVPYACGDCATRQVDVGSHK